MTNTSLLEEYIERSGYKRSYIASKIGRSPYALAQKINNESEFKASEIETLCSLLGISIKDRMTIFFAKGVD